ncbi:olfactory receptor 56A4-like [Lissotriton helveticus]
MLALNITSSFQVSQFVLVCFPSIQSWQHWLSIPLVLLFFLAIVANITILMAMGREKSLHEPMYYFLGFLSVFDLVLCTATVPKVLGILCFNWKAIDKSVCFLQMYIMNCFLGMESNTFLVMAYDRYTAICNPLRYRSIMTVRFVRKALVFIILRSALVLLPMPVLAARLPYCSKNVVEHCLCTNVAVTSLACADPTINTVYQLVLGFGFMGSDLLLIILSYFLILRAVWKLQVEGAAAKAFSTCSSHLILISFFYTIISVLIFTNLLEKVIPPDVPILLNVLHNVLPPALNPIFYGLRTTEILQGVVKMIRKGRTNHKAR